MNTLREAAQQALEVLENDVMQRTFAGGVRISNAALALRAALAEPEKLPMVEIETVLAVQAEPVQEPEPVAFKDAPGRIYLQVCEDDFCEVPFRDHEATWCEDKINDLDVPYVRADLAAPPQRKPLTDEEIAKMFEEVVCALPPYPSVTEEMPERFARAVERAHGIGGEP